MSVLRILAFKTADGEGNSYSNTEFRVFLWVNQRAQKTMEFSI